MVLFMTISHKITEVTEQSKLKQISYDGNSFVGLDVRYDEADEIMPENELWYTYSWKKLIDIVGINLALEISRRIKLNWKYENDAEDQKAIESVEKLINFVDASCALYDSWHDNINDGYPFGDDKPFEEVLIEIMNWQQKIMNRLSK